MATIQNEIQKLVRYVPSLIWRQCAFFFFPIALAVATPAQACDICAIYIATRAQDQSDDAWRVSLREQFTEYEGRRNNFRQSIDSSTTQLGLSYRISESLSAQATLPYIYRSFDRLERGRPRSGSESGIGDLSLLISYQPIAKRDAKMPFYLQLFGGVKLPTGDSDRLAEEAQEPDIVSPSGRNDDPRRFHGGAGGNLVNGADLALGSGSFDFIFGAQAFLQYERVFASSYLQYFLRTEGDHDFEYGDDFIWSIGPGVYVYAEHEQVVSLQYLLRGEYQNNDKLRGSTLPGSDIRRLYMGPALALNLGPRWNVDASISIPISVGDSSESVEPEMRYEFSLLYRF